MLGGWGSMVKLAVGGKGYTPYTSLAARSSQPASSCDFVSMLKPSENTLEIFKFMDSEGTFFFFFLMLFIFINPSLHI